MIDFVMPSLGPDMESARLIEWLVKPGDRLKRGDIIAVVETEKGAIEIEVFDDATVSELVAAIDAELSVGTVLARLEPAEGSATHPVPRAVATPTAAPGPLAAPVAARTPLTAAAMVPPPAEVPRPPVQFAHGFVRASPAARARAAARGIDLRAVPGSGPDGAVVLADLERAPPATSTGEPRARRTRGFDPTAMRHAIAQAMSRAKREIPHYYLAQTISLGKALRWLAQANAERSVTERLLPAVLLLRASGRALADVPALNGHYVDGAFRPGSGVHVGWAVALRGGGLIAPAIHDVDRKDLAQLMADMRDVVQRARGGGLRGSELMDATATVTSLGERGADSVLPIIQPPQVAMIGFGRIVERPWVVDDRIEIQPQVSVTLAGDHRASDGHLGSQLLATIERLLNQPESL